MNNNTKSIIVLVVFAGVGFYVYTNTKRYYANVIVNKGKYGSGVDALMTFDKDFLKVWSKASKKNEPTFTLNGKIFNTQGGTTK
jgi:hypothetical protein